MCTRGSRGTPGLSKWVNRDVKDVRGQWGRQEVQGGQGGRQCIPGGEEGCKVRLGGQGKSRGSKGVKSDVGGVLGGQGGRQGCWVLKLFRKYSLEKNFFLLLPLPVVASFQLVPKYLSKMKVIFKYFTLKMGAKEQIFLMRLNL